MLPSHIATLCGMCDVSFICVTCKQCHTFGWVMSHVWMSLVTHQYVSYYTYGVATVSRINTILGLFCKRDLPKRRYSAKDTYDFIDPTDRSHPISWFTSHTSTSVVTHMNESCHTYEWVMSHIWMRYVTHVNKSCHTYEWVMSHMCMSHVTHTITSCHTYEWVMSHECMSHIPMCISHVTHMNESCHTYEWVTSQICMSHVKHINESCHT